MKKALIGAGGHAREVESYLDEEVIFFVDNKYVDEDNPQILSLDTFSNLDLIILKTSTHEAFSNLPLYFI